MFILNGQKNKISDEFVCNLKNVYFKGIKEQFDAIDFTDNANVCAEGVNVVYNY